MTDAPTLLPQDGRLRAPTEGALPSAPDLEQILYPFPVALLGPLAAAVRDVPRASWGDVAVARLRGVPGMRDEWLLPYVFTTVVDKVMRVCPLALGLTPRGDSLLVEVPGRPYVTPLVDACIFL